MAFSPPRDWKLLSVQRPVRKELRSYANGGALLVDAEAGDQRVVRRVVVRCTTNVDPATGTYNNLIVGFSKGGQGVNANWIDFFLVATNVETTTGTAQALSEIDVLLPAGDQLYAAYVPQVSEAADAALAFLYVERWLAPDAVRGSR